MPRYSNRIFKKRGPIGKRKAVDSASDSNDRPSQNAKTPKVSESPSCSSRPSPKISASKKKLSDSDYAIFDNNSEYGNEVIDLELLSSALLENTLCKHCTQGSMSIRKVGRQFGLASKMLLVCNICQYESYFFNSNKCIVDVAGQQEQAFEVNLRLAYGLRSIGKGPSAARMLCGVMNLPSPSVKNSKNVNILKTAVKELAEKSMKLAVTEAVEENSTESEIDDRDLTAAFDGTWQKRGHQSLNGVVTCTSVDTGKVLDVEILTKHCLCLDKNCHDDNCKANYSGSSGGMEVAGVQAIFSRSKEKYNVQYTKFLGDGDSAAFGSVVRLDPYNGIEITKLECVGHIQKRMGSRLRKLKTKLGKQKLCDGKPIGGKNRLTDAVIDILQSYYGQAIRNNVSSVTDMKKAIWAIFFHKLSTNESPQHGLCPKEETTWCKYNRSLITNEKYDHKNSLPSAIMTEIKPIFRDLSDENLLKKCTHGNTQNVNESLNNVIWSRLPKKTFVGKDILELGVYDAIASFNLGLVTKCQVLDSIKIKPGCHMISAMKALDAERVYAADKAMSDFERKARRMKRLQTKKLEDQYEDKQQYEAGMF